MIQTNNICNSFYIADRINNFEYPITKQIFEIGDSSRKGNDSSIDRRNSFSSLDSSSSSSNSFATNPDPSDASIVNGKMIILHYSTINDNDILCGRDKVSFSHIGNKKFRAMIDRRRKEYQSSTLKEEKTKIIVQIVTMIKENNGRFLKRTSTDNLNTNDSILLNALDSTISSQYWYAVNDQCAHEKVSHALRSCKHRKKKPSILKKKKPPVKKTLTEEQHQHFKHLLAFQGMFFNQLLKCNTGESDK